MVNVPINFFASVRFITKFILCNGLKYGKIRYKSSGNNVITRDFSAVYRLVVVYF